MGWLDCMSRAMDTMRDCGHKLFPERRVGLCRHNTPDDRRRRKDRARELTRLNMQRKREMA